MCSPGLLQSYDTLEWIWDHQFSVCACDNFGLECFPPVPDSPFAGEIKHLSDVHPRHTGMMHSPMIALLGLTIGEQWNSKVSRPIALRTEFGNVLSGRSRLI